MIGDIEIREGLDGLSPARIITLYRRAPLLRAVDTPARVWSKFESSLVLTAWNGADLVGIGRVLSDGFSYSMLCELAVEPDVQRLGIGKALLDAIVERCRGTELILMDSRLSSSFYRKRGFREIDNAWVRKL